MPMLDLELPNGVLDEAAERALIATLTDTLIRWEGADPANQRVRDLAWVFVHRGAEVSVAGAPVTTPHYRVRVSVPQGQFNDERRAGMVAAVTEAILDAEAGCCPRDNKRVWVFTNEVPDGTWGGDGRIWRLEDVAGHVFGDPERGRAYAAKRLPAREPALR